MFGGGLKMRRTFMVECIMKETGKPSVNLYIMATPKSTLAITAYRGIGGKSARGGTPCTKRVIFSE